MWEILFSTHHTDIGLLYIITSVAFLMMGGALAMALRAELFSCIIVVRYHDMAWPKLNAVAFWMIPVTAAMIWIGFSDTGWTAYPPYSTIRAPGPAADLWIFGAKILGISSVLGAINFVVTILRCKHPDLPLMKMTLFSWSILITSLMIIVAVPTFAASLIMLYTDRLGISGFFNPEMGGDPIAYQHLFWFTFHPEVYIFLIPAVGMLYEIIPRFSKKPIFSYQSGVVAFVLLGIISFSSWAHHMFAVGIGFTEKTVFMIGTLAAVPASAMHVFNWIATMWGGRIKFALLCCLQ